jgi:hypothetical protein
MKRRGEEERGDILDFRFDFDKFQDNMGILSSQSYSSTKRKLLTTIKPSCPITYSSAPLSLPVRSVRVMERYEKEGVHTTQIDIQD